MNATHINPLAQPSDGQLWRAPLKEWWPVVVGLLVLYVPTVVELSGDVWRQEDHWHEPVLLAVSLYLMWRKGVLAPGARPASGGCWWLIGTGLVMYVVSRALGVLSVEMLSMIPVFAGAIWLMRGRAALKALVFPVVFLVFAVPMPPFLIDWISGGLKTYVSNVVTAGLYYLGYPIAREGVVIMIGPYQLLVADACSGMRSLYSLTALGLLYVYIKGYRNPLRSVTLVASLLPIGLAANILRVALLALLTFHFGESMAEGAVHDILGIGVFVVDLALLLVMDRLTAFMDRRPA
jgi:exosortase B